MNNKFKKLSNQNMSKVSGGMATRTVYSGNTPNFDHPIKSEALASSKHCEDKHEDGNLLIDSEIDNLTIQ